MYVRVSHMVPKEGQEQRLIQVLQQLSALYREQPGYLGGWVLSPYPEAPETANRFGRVGTWESQDAAEDAAQQQRALSLRSELLRMVEEDSHYEFSFSGQPDNL